MPPITNEKPHLPTTLPSFSATGAYMRNQKEFSLLNNDQKAALSGVEIIWRSH